ncbi:hypothetical protein [Methanosarcina sp. WWM596]|uniref:hypothetical protein n=1 Tax=Methanosarcina sp. WWM596 TaxID=1434103 RepID=UPI000AB3858C|nr:hypothetical protein [Methanosarcina sp. WWM596]
MAYQSLALKLLKATDAFVMKMWRKCSGSNLEKGIVCTAVNEEIKYCVYRL